MWRRDRVSQPPRHHLLSGAARLYFAGVVVAFGALGLAPVGFADSSSGAPPFPTLELTDQSWTVSAGQAFDVSVNVASSGATSTSGSRSSAFAMGLEVTVYSPLVTRTALDQTFAGKPSGAILEGPTQAIPFSTLSPDPHGGYSLGIGVGCGSIAPPSSGTEVQVQLPSYPCTGVYPVRIRLTSGSGTEPTPSLITEMVVVGKSPLANPLEVAWVLPLGLGPQAVDSFGHQVGPPPEELSSLEALAGVVAGAGSSIPLTVEVDPATLTTLDRIHPSAIGPLVSAATEPTHQDVVTTYSYIDTASYLGAGLGSEVGDQFTQARATVSQAPHDLHATTSTWVVPSVFDKGSLVPEPFDSASLAGLSSIPGSAIAQIVLPAQDVGGAQCGNDTCSAPFALEGAAGPVQGILSDPGLEADLVAGSSVLDAHQLLADLALIYYEEPSSAPAARVVVLDSPQGWHPDASFVSQVLTGLKATPVLEPVTLATAFAVADGSQSLPGGLQPKQRSLSTTAEVAASVTALSAPTVRSIRAGRQRLEAFASALLDPSVVGTDPTAHARISDLDDQLLESESSLLGTKDQESDISGFMNAVSAQYAGLELPPDTVRLTASRATVPFSILKPQSVPPLAATLSLSSDKLIFDPGPRCVGTKPRPGGFTGVECPIVLDHSTNSVQITLRSRASGDFPVTVTLMSPKGGLVLAQGHLTVRSFSASLVAVVLTAIALAVLLLWWGRTWWRGRRGKPPRGRRSVPTGSIEHTGS